MCEVQTIFSLSIYFISNHVIHHFSIIGDLRFTLVKEIKDSYTPAKKTELRFEFSFSSPKASDLSRIG